MVCYETFVIFYSMAFLSKGIPKIIITEEFTIVLFCFFCYNNDNKVNIL